MERPVLDPQWAIGIWPNVIEAAAWPEIEAMLVPAAERGGGEVEVGDGWQVWTVHRGKKLVGAATTRLTVNGTAEVVLVGGVDCREWIEPLDDLIGCWAAEEGATELRAGGRKGWAPILTAQGWSATPMGKFMEYRRGLG